MCVLCAAASAPATHADSATMLTHTDSLMTLTHADSVVMLTRGGMAVTMTRGELRSALVFGSEASASDARSVPLAFGMSALLPGLGQAYNDDWMKGAVALAVEGGLIIGYILWKNQGLDAEDAYQAYAHDYWDPVQYASWLNDYVEYLEVEHGATIGVAPIDAPNQIDFTNPSSWSESQRQIVRSFFDEIRSVEGRVYHPETGASFSHHLPYFAEQQYYELIGKYFQFAPGWVDYPAWKSGAEFTSAIDPELTGPGGSKPNVRGRFLEYAREHADANTLLRRASRVSAVILLNHIVAAFDAAISAKLHNDRLDADLDLGYDPVGSVRLQTTLRWRF